MRNTTAVAELRLALSEARKFAVQLQHNAARNKDGLVAMQWDTIATNIATIDHQVTTAARAQKPGFDIEAPPRGMVLS